VEALAAEAGQKVLLAGNLPYHIASPLLMRILGARAAIRTFAVMLQKEVAERICAPPSTKAYGFLSVLLGMFADLDIALRVSRRSFHPVPAVDSAVLRGRFLPGPRHPLPDLEALRRTARASFSQRRKMLRGALTAAFGPAGLNALTEAGIAPERRGETLDLEEFSRLATALVRRTG
jgi:16S rRNA (adenine1518-N6/adenine1519-N6)-dimethyltransferase